MIKNYTILVFLKFGSKENIVDLYENGTIYMNSIQQFRTLEDKFLRGDKYEGVISIMNSLPGEIEILGIKINYISVHLPKFHQITYGNIYSLYCISSYTFDSPDDFCIDEKVKQFGSHVLVIKQPGEFLRRIEEKLSELELKWHHGFVNYYNRKDFNGTVNVFQKPNEFEYQKEFRFYIEVDDTVPIVFKVGSLKDIAEVHSSDIVDELKLIRTSPSV